VLAAFTVHLVMLVRGTVKKFLSLLEHFLSILDYSFLQNLYMSVICAFLNDSYESAVDMMSL